MKLLLDTHAFIWWVLQPHRLPQSVVTAFEDSNNSLILSIASAWEMQIKIQIGKLHFNLPLKTIIEPNSKPTTYNSCR
jgi:PIN domain nuclease of toxin-antitoxin system